MAAAMLISAINIPQARSAARLSNQGFIVALPVGTMRGMDVYEIRRANLRALIAEFGRSSVLDQMQMSRSQLSQVAGRNPVRQIGAALARRFEATFQKPEGWMDHSQGPQDQALRDLIDYARRLTPEGLAQLTAFVRTIAARPQQDEQAPGASDVEGSDRPIAVRRAS